MTTMARRIANENDRAWVKFRAGRVDYRCQVTGCRKVVGHDDYCYGCKVFVCGRREHWPRRASWVGDHNDRADHRTPNRLVGEATRSLKNLIAPQRDANRSSCPSPSQDSETP